MIDRVVVTCEAEFWELVARAGGVKHSRHERLRVGKALELLKVLGLEPSWRPDDLPIGALVIESRAMRLGPTLLAELLGGHYEAIKKVFTDPTRCPCFDVAVRWAVLVAQHAARRGLD